METFFPMTRLALNHVQVMVRGMWAVAECDGVHEQERTMLRAFYEACSEDSGALTSFQQLVSQRFDAAEAIAILDTPELKQVFLKSCMFLAYADGTYSDKEQAFIAELASSLGVDEASLREIHNQVGDHLIGQVARVQNVEGLKQVVDEVFGRS